MNTTRIVEALEILGPEKVERGLQAFRNPIHTFEGCFLALCYGPRGTFRIALGHVPTYTAICHLLGLNCDQTAAILDAFDGRFIRVDGGWARSGPADGFEELVEGWLEDKRNVEIEEVEMAVCA